MTPNRERKAADMKPRRKFVPTEAQISLMQKVADNGGSIHFESTGASFRTLQACIDRQWIKTISFHEGTIAEMTPGGVASLSLWK